MAELKPFEIQQFGGLNLKDDPKEFGWSAATSGKNFSLDRDGRLRMRDGTTLHSDLSCDSFQGPVPYSTVGGTDYLVAFCKTTSTKTCTLKYVTTAGSVSSAGGAWTGATAAPTIRSVTKFDVPGASSVVFTSVDSSTSQQWKYWPGSGNVTDHPTAAKPLYVGVTPQSNRVVTAGFAAAADSPTGADGSYSTVFFSRGGNSESWGANDYVHLSPGDGEQITGVAAYRDFLLVFKETQFFVFYGEGTDSTGGAVFDYRTVQVPVGRIRRSGDISNAQVCAGPDGVYFIAGQRVYRTDGGRPEWVSEALGESALVLPSVHVANNAVYVVVNTAGTTSTAMFVYDVEDGTWAKWDQVGPPVPFSNDLVSKLSAGSAGDQDILVEFSSATYTDCLTASSTTAEIEFEYVTGEQRVSPPGSEGVIREVLFEGVASVFNASVTADGTSTASAGLVASATSLGRFRKACRGRAFKLTIEDNSGSSVPLTFSSVIANVAPGRSVGAS